MIEEQKEALAAEEAQREYQAAADAAEKVKQEQKKKEAEEKEEAKKKQSKAALKLQQALELKFQNLQSYADDFTKYQPRFVLVASNPIPLQVSQ